MKRNNYIVCLMAALGFMAAGCANVDNDGVNRETGLPNAIYFEGTESSPLKKLTVDVDGGTAQLTARASNLLSADSEIKLVVDDATLEKYNEANGTIYKVLPAEYYNISAQELTIAKGNVSAEPVSVTVKPEALKLNPSYKYAIPLKITGDGSIGVLESSAATILALDRVLETDAMRQDGFCLRMTNPTPWVMDEWTLHYGLCPDAIFANEAVLSTVEDDGGFYSRIVEGGAIQFKTNGTDDPNAFTKSKIKAGEWWHITFAYSNGLMKVYVNGVLDNEFQSKANKFGTFNLSWGAFRGYVRDIRLYNKTLSAFQINDVLYVDDESNPNLVFYAPLTSETKLKNVKDASGATDFKLYMNGSSDPLENPDSQLKWKTFKFPENK